jgi:hypothetical protein
MSHARLRGLAGCVELTDEVRRAEATIFHRRADVFANLHYTRSDFQAVGLPFNSALQYLILLAAHDVWDLPSAPALSHAVSTDRNRDREDNVDWVYVAASGVAELRRRMNAGSIGPGEAFAAFQQLANKHVVKVATCRECYSPTFFVRPPRTTWFRALAQFFVDVSHRYEPAYRAYLFRAMRQRNTVDILTSCLALPPEITCVGRPGAVCEVTRLFGLHVLQRRDATDLVYIPHPSTVHDTERFHRALVRWTEELMTAARAEPEPLSSRRRPIEAT